MFSTSFLIKFGYLKGVELCILQSLDAKAQKALECPCIADLRSGPCGLQFSEAFVCYLKSTVEEKVTSNYY